MPQHFVSKVIAPESLEEPALWFVFFEHQILLFQNTEQVEIPRHTDFASLGLLVVMQQYLGLWHKQHCFCAEISTLQKLPENYILQPFRQAALQFDAETFDLASRALQILQWDKNHQFCSHCGTPLEYSTTERAKNCPKCGMQHYPRISPTIIVLIKRGKEILLARSPHFTPGIFSTLAGFIEPGESAEQAVEREVFEEVGVTIKNLKYRFSQSWPFPHSLMLAFTAEHAAGEIVIDGVEIEAAGWYTLDNLPPLPSPIGISRKLIDLFINQEF